MSNNIDLVTITCARDCGIQLLQSYSLDLMVTDFCNHYVVIEDNKLSMEEWYALLTPYYTRHRLHLISGSSLLSSEYYANDSQIKNGWHRSAVLKLLIADKIQSKKYLILDSKNFFVRQQSLNEWPLEDGNGIIEKYNSYGWIEVDEFCLKNNIAITENVYNSSTPFMVNTDIVKKIIEFDFLCLFFNKKRWWSSELFLYSIFTQHVGNKLKSKPVTNVTFWNTERRLNKKTLDDIYSWKNMRTFGLHRNILKLGTDLTGFVDFLVGLGFKKSIVETGLTQYKQDINEK
jgi:hypothetical protein